jgi:hypothetical protein
LNAVGNFLDRRIGQAEVLLTTLIGCHTDHVGAIFNRLCQIEMFRSKRIDVEK